MMTRTGWRLLILAFLLLLPWGASAADGLALMPEALTTIGADAFRDDASLVEAVVSDRVTTIGAGAFAGSGLQVVYLPKSVAEIGEGAFAGCDGLGAVVAEDSYALRWCKQAGIPYAIGAYGDPLVTFAEEQTVVKNGASLQMTAETLLPGLAVTWTTSDANILTVDENGLVFGNYPGTALLTASVLDGRYTARIRVQVQANYRALLFSESTFSGGVIQRNRGDVRLMTNMLKTVTGPDGGVYEVHSFDDLTATQVYQKITDYLVTPSRDGDVSMFFFASHGDKYSKDYQNAGRLYCKNKATWLCLPDLADALSLIQGKVVVILESCGPGAAVHDFSRAPGLLLASTGGAAALPEDDGWVDDPETAAAMISIFSAADPGLMVYAAPDPDSPVQPRAVNRFLTEKFEILCAAEYLQTSYMYQGDTKNLFPYWLVTGVGASGSMPADVEYGNSDGVLTFHELFRYVYARTKYRQTACCYPQNSAYQLFRRIGE